jgi:microcystin-dependent protein
MSDSYIGEIRMFAGNFAPAGWSFCEGQLMPISENDALFALLGTTYGGDGQETFALPDLRGRLPIHFGGGMSTGESGGAESVTLTVNQLPTHSHALMASTNTATQTTPNTTVLGTPTAIDLYRVGSASSPMASQLATPVGGSQPHDNSQPYLCISFIISLFGIYPSQA